MEKQESSLKIAVTVVTTIMSAAILGTASMLISLSNDAVRIETVALFHKQKIDELSVRIGVLEERTRSLTER